MDYVSEVVRGKIPPKNIWLEDVDVTYGAIHGKEELSLDWDGDTLDEQHDYTLSLWSS